MTNQPTCQNCNDKGYNTTVSMTTDDFGGEGGKMFIEKVPCPRCSEPSCDKCDNPITVVIHGNPEMNLCREHFNEWCEKRKKDKYQEASTLYRLIKHETKSERGIERIRKALDEARQEGHAVGYDECLGDYPEPEGDSLPMGVSEWREHGIKHGYWDYFRKDCLERAREAIKEAYFDLTTHPSEAGPKGAALLDEYLTNLESRLEAELTQPKE